MFAHKSLLKGNSCFIMKKKKGAHYTRKGGVGVLHFLKIPAEAAWIKKRLTEEPFLFLRGHLHKALNTKKEGRSNEGETPIKEKARQRAILGTLSGAYLHHCGA